MDFSYFSDKRRLFFNFVQKVYPNFKNCNSDKQFLHLLSTDNEIILKKLVQFKYNSFKKRSPFLDKLDLNQSFFIIYYLLSYFLKKGIKVTIIRLDHI